MKAVLSIKIAHCAFDIFFVLTKVATLTRDSFLIY